MQATPTAKAIDPLPTGERVYLVSRLGSNLQCRDEKGGARCYGTSRGDREAVLLTREGEHYVITSVLNGRNLLCLEDGGVGFKGEAKEAKDPSELWSVERKDGAVFFVSKQTKQPLQCDSEGRVQCAAEDGKSSGGYRAWRILDDEVSLSAPSLLLYSLLSSLLSLLSLLSLSSLSSLSVSDCLSFVLFVSVIPLSVNL
jgi:hypothetical protein